ncbi:hypothetical protein A9Z42_0080510 [Trichoderma parareesei]|uniref:Uncharacterized protein n=1 Tax=Trichoderma parareesei TaxID=858221 RepID=A0A2H2ZR43_TRIPA|nr:hypothetical protein A9Z42_0080510 [Trichoderma parareesei]
MADDKALSEKIISQAEALQQWGAIEPYVTGVTSFVEEYREIIDGVGNVFAVVGFVWNIYSEIEKAKENAAQQQAMVTQIIRAVDGMITHATAEIKQHINQKEVQAALNSVMAVQQGFYHDVLPYAKTYPLTGVDIGHIVNLIEDSRKAIETLHALIPERANDCDGAAVLSLYRSLHAAVQCKLTMDRWHRGLTQAVITEAEYEMTRLIQVWVPVVRGLQGMSDRSFSPGIVYFHAGGHGRPEFTKYSYYYMGKAQPGSSSVRAPVSQAFIEARKAARNNAIPQEVYEWNSQPYRIMNELRELKDKVLV